MSPADPASSEDDQCVVDPRILRLHRDRAAARYRETSAVTDEVARRMAERLDVVRLPDGDVLDLGCADGVWTGRLRERFPGRKVIGLDPSRALMQAAVPVAEARPWWRPWASAPVAPPRVCADLDALPFRPGSFAFVWSNLAAHWFARPRRTWRAIGVSLRPGGLLMFSTFGPDTLRELRRAWDAGGDAASVMPFADMHNVGDALVHAGFSAPVMDMEVLTLTYPDAGALFADLRGQGATDARPGRFTGLRSPRWRAGRERALEGAKRGERVEITVEIVYGHAWWPEGGASRTSDGRDVVRIHGLARGGRGVSGPR